MADHAHTFFVVKCRLSNIVFENRSHILITMVNTDIDTVVEKRKHICVRRAWRGFAAGLKRIVRVQFKCRDICNIIVRYVCQSPAVSPQNPIAASTEP